MQHSGANNPYDNLPPSAFWRTGVAQENPADIKDIYKKKFNISKKTKIATAGSCFAQHISRHLKKNSFNVMDVEPPPPGLPEELHHSYGFSMYSARCGNIYTTKHLLQLAQEAAGEWTPADWIWAKEGRYYDAFRPSVEPHGLASAEDVIAHRAHHIRNLRKLFESLDLFIFTLGLTEMWINKQSGYAYPIAPGVIAGKFEEEKHEFRNAGFHEVIRDFTAFRKTVKKIRNGRPFRTLLTVSPVPLTATASGSHVLTSTVHSKAILRAAAGELSSNQKRIDYFPSYEIATNPRLYPSSFSDNLRTIREDAVEVIMNHFFMAHSTSRPHCSSNSASLATTSATEPATEPATTITKNQEKIQCEEALLDAFGQ